MKGLKREIQRKNFNMKDRFEYSMVAIISLICGVVWAQSNLKIGVVNIKRVFDESLEAKEIKNELEKQQKELERKFLEMEKKMRELQEEIKQLSQQQISLESLTIEEKERELATVKALYERDRQKWGQILRDKVNKFTLDLYNKFRNTIEEYGIKNQFTIIFKVEGNGL